MYLFTYFFTRGYLLHMNKACYIYNKILSDFSILLANTPKNFAIILQSLLQSSLGYAKNLKKKIIYRVVQKTDTQFYFWDNFGNSAPILTILSLLQAEIYGA